MIFLRP